MKHIRCSIVVPFIALVCSSSAFTFSGVGEPVLMIPNASDDTVALFSSFDGSLIDPNFIDAERLGLFTSVFVEAQRVGDEIWVTDALDDVVFRFSLNGRESLGTIADLNLNNPEGYEIVGDKMLVASRYGIITIDIPSATFQGVHDYRGADSSINDIKTVGGVLLVSNSDTDDIDIIDSEGNLLSTLIDSDGVTGFNFPQQINETMNGQLLVASFAPPGGIYLFDTDGSVGGPALAPNNAVRGVQELGDGNLIFTNNTGVFVLDTDSGDTRLISTGRSSFITVLDHPPCMADLNGDAVLDFFDIAAFLGAFANGDQDADFVPDGTLDFADVLAFLRAFTTGCP